MAEPAYWQTVAPADTWDPLFNSPNELNGDWTELQELTQPGDESYTADEGRAVLRGLVPWNKRYDARRKMLGYAWADTGPPYELHRVNPIPCPGEEHLRCVSVSYSGHIINVREDAAGGPAAFANFDPAPLPPGPPAGLIRLPHRARYAFAEFTLTFRDHPFLYVEDANFYDSGTSGARLPEYERNCDIFEECSPSVGTVSAQTQPFVRWKDGNPGAGGPTAGQLLPADTQFSEYLATAQLVICWYDVPDDYLFGGSPFPPKITPAIGCVNSATWLGAFPAGTLRLSAPRFRRRTLGHIRTADLLGTPANNIPFVYDVRLVLDYVNPTPADLPGGAAPFYRGFNMSKYGPNGGWYAVERTGGVPYFPPYDFDKLFLHANAP